MNQSEGQNKVYEEVGITPQKERGKRQKNAWL